MLAQTDKAWRRWVLNVLERHQISPEKTARDRRKSYLGPAIAACVARTGLAANTVRRRIHERFAVNDIRLLPAEQLAEVERWLDGLNAFDPGTASDAAAGPTAALVRLEMTLRPEVAKAVMDLVAAHSEQKE